MNKRLYFNFSSVIYCTGALYNDDVDKVMAYAKENDCSYEDAILNLHDCHEINIWENANEEMADDIQIDKVDLE